MFTNSEEYLNLPFIWDDEISAAILRETGEIFLLLYFCCITVVEFIYFWVLRRFQHCTGHITTGSWKGGGNQYIQFARFLYCKLPTNGKQLPAFPLEAMTGIQPRPQWCTVVEAIIKL